eukprot:4874418-Amphidinium_carterae.1
MMPGYPSVFVRAIFYKVQTIPGECRHNELCNVLKDRGKTEAQYEQSTQGVNCPVPSSALRGEADLRDEHP